MWKDCIPVFCVIILLFSFCSESLSQNNTDDLISSTTDETVNESDDTTDMMITTSTDNIQSTEMETVETFMMTEESTSDDMDVMTEISSNDMMNITELGTTTMETISSDDVASSSNAINSTDTFDSMGNTFTFSDDSTQQTKMSTELIFLTFLLLSLLI